MPRGDSILRNAFFDALMFDCIPVMSEADYVRYCPYNDVVNYHAFVNIAPGPENGSVITSLAEGFNERKMLAALQRLRKVFPISGLTCLAACSPQNNTLSSWECDLYPYSCLLTLVKMYTYHRSCHADTSCISVLLKSCS